MDESGSKTIMCSVLFLDISEYSKKQVAEQIILKEAFNSFLAKAIRDIPINDRIILDTGDGAAISFLGDVSDALKVTLSLRESFFQCAPPAPEVLQDGLDILLHTDLRAELGQLNIPVRVLHGDVDKLAPVSAGRWLAQQLPLARAEICAGASHAPFLSHPGWFADRIKDFLGG